MTGTRLTLFELAGADPDLRFSPHCWKTRMALAHKGLEAERVPWRFTEKDRLAFSGQGRVPVLVDGEQTICDSWRIALYLETRFAEGSSLFGGPDAIPLTEFLNAWADSVLLPALAPIIILDIFQILHENDRVYFRTSREARFGAT
jgi:glutathione S-transferase